MTNFHELRTNELYREYFGDFLNSKDYRITRDRVLAYTKSVSRAMKTTGLKKEEGMKAGFQSTEHG